MSGVNKEGYLKEVINIQFNTIQIQLLILCFKVKNPKTSTNLYILLTVTIEKDRDNFSEGKNCV